MQVDATCTKTSSPPCSVAFVAVILLVDSFANVAALSATTNPRQQTQQTTKLHAASLVTTKRPLFEKEARTKHRGNTVRTANIKQCSNTTVQSCCRRTTTFHSGQQLLVNTHHNLNHGQH